MRTSAVGALLVLLAGCGSDAAQHVTEQDAARARWIETRADCSTYHYTLNTDSFTGTRTRTSFELVGDQPTKRMFVRGRQSFSGMSQTFVIDESWLETGDEIGTHPDVELPRTMEQLYDECARDVLTQDPAKNTIMFAADARGLIQQCFFVPNNCADGCAMGDVLTGFGCGPLDTTEVRP